MLLRGSEGTTGRWGAYIGVLADVGYASGDSGYGEEALDMSVLGLSESSPRLLDGGGRGSSPAQESS